MEESLPNRDRIPAHVAIIMDGNGRWAESRGISRLRGHRAGLQRVRDVLRASNDLGIQYLTLYAFSLENWNRPKTEVDGLMSLLIEYMERELNEVDRNGIRVRAIGRLDRLPGRVQKAVENAIERTRENSEMTLTFALSYGGRAEIVDAARKMVLDAERGTLLPKSIDEKTFRDYLYDPTLPDPDLLIRTGAEVRVSNFLLWQIAYAEIHNTNVMWPDFQKQNLVDAILDYQGRERRFGMTGSQVREGGS
ncbi:isoprenyl transferase [Myxococcota bacterium]|nr:isoprenyl transferase [Myxococcota bacterium]